MISRGFIRSRKRTPGPARAGMNLLQSRAFSKLLLDRYLQVDRRVQEALNNGEPVVALESTIVAHGMPYPQNLETAEDVEAIVRSLGVTPATIAILDGKCRVGLLPHELEDLAKAGEENRATKCSTRELPLLLSASSSRTDNAGKKQWGATTVASTMTLAHAAGISSFVTGGIGGVHRNGHISMDVSADLTELSRTPVVVVSAGIKSILDIPRTLEVLETNAVPTVAYQTNEFPCFFSPNSGIMAPARVESADEVASSYWAARALNLSNGMLVAVPPPDPAGHAIEETIQEALEEAEAQGIHGQAVTPFILKRVAEITKGDSLRCNISLVKHNAEVGSEIAVAIAEQRSATAVGIIPPDYPEEDFPNLPTFSRIIVMGGTVLDIVAKPTSDLIMGTSNPATCTESDGGVARNVAEVLGRLGSTPLLYSAVGNDARGLALQQRQEEYGIQDSNLTIHTLSGSNTATYLAVLEGTTNDLHTACADMAVMDHIRPPPREVLQEAEMLLMDANPPLSALKEAAQIALECDVDVFFEPTSVPKAYLAANDHDFLRYLSGAFPNLDELQAMRDAACGSSSSSSSSSNDSSLDFEAVETMAEELLGFMAPNWAYLVITLGEYGVMLASRGSESDSFQVRHFPIEEEVQVQNSTGAGDSLCGGFLHATLQGKDVSEAISLGMMAASISLGSKRTIAEELSVLRENSQ